VNIALGNTNSGFGVERLGGKELQAEYYVGRVQMKRQLIPMACAVLMIFLGPRLAAA
jgi:hypothetical protein